MVRAEPSAPEMSAASEILIARVSQLIYTLVQRAPQAAVMQAAASGSTAALLDAVASMVVTAAPADDAWTVSRLRGTVALAHRVEAAGGVWSAEEATTHLQVKRQALHQWRDAGRVIALQRSDGSFSYPVAQFQPANSDLTAPRPYPAIAEITATIGARMSAEELVAILATPQPMLAHEDGSLQTPFAALEAGESDRVLALVRWVATPADADAPDIATATTDTTTA